MHSFRLLSLSIVAACSATLATPALAQATSPREWNLLFLASPEFMRG